MNRLLAIAMLLAGLCVGGGARAQDTVAPREPLRLEEVLASVERSFPLLKAAELEQAIASSDVLSAEGAFDVSWKTRGTVTPVGYYDSIRAETTIQKPTTLWGITPFAGWKYGTGQFAVYDGRLQTLEYGELRAGVNVPLWRNGPIDRGRASLARAELGKEVAVLSVAEQRIQFRRAATHRYWIWVAAGRRLAIAQELARNVEGRDEGLGARVQHGDLPRYERTDNARAMEQRRAQVASAQRDLEQATIELGLFMRDAAGRPSPPPTERMPAGFPEPAAEAPTSGVSEVSLALSRRPEARRVQLQLAQTGIELDYAKNQLRPGIDLQLAGSQDIGRSLVSRPDLAKPVFEVTLMLDLPLQTRVMRGRAEAASASAARLSQQLAYARDRIEADVRSAHAGIRGSRARFEAARREVELATELASGERTRFEQGDSHLLFVNIREQQTAEAELREVDSLLDYYRSIADLSASRGQ